MKKIRAELEAHLDPDSGVEKSWRRNASLAYVKFHFQNCVAFSSDSENITNNSLSIETIALIKYLYEYGDTYTIYGDLRPFLEVLRPSERSKIFSILTSSVTTIDLACHDEQKKLLIPMVEKISSTDVSSTQKIDILAVCHI